MKSLPPEEHRTDVNDCRISRPPQTPTPPICPDPRLLRETAGRRCGTTTSTFRPARRGHRSATISALTDDTTRTASAGDETGIETTGAAIGTTIVTETAGEATGDETMSAGNASVTGADRRAARGSARATGIGIGNDAETATETETGQRVERGGETASVIETDGESELSSYVNVHVELTSAPGVHPRSSGESGRKRSGRRRLPPAARPTPSTRAS